MNGSHEVMFGINEITKEFMYWDAQTGLPIRFKDQKMGGVGLLNRWERENRKTFDNTNILYKQLPGTEMMVVQY